MTDNITLPRAVVERALAAFEQLVRQNYRLGTEFDDRAKALRSALEQPQVQSGGIPPNWKLVPEEPADSQIRAAQDTWWHACNCETYWDQIYAAMIAAAPQPPVVGQPQVEQELDAFYEWWHMRPSLTRLQAWLLWKDEQKQFERAHGIGGEA